MHEHTLSYTYIHTHAEIKAIYIYTHTRTPRGPRIHKVCLLSLSPSIWIVYMCVYMYTPRIDTASGRVTSVCVCASLYMRTVQDRNNIYIYMTGVYVTLLVEIHRWCV